MIFVYMVRSKSSRIDFISKLGNTLHLIINVLFLKVSTIYYLLKYIFANASEPAV